MLANLHAPLFLLTARSFTTCGTLVVALTAHLLLPPAARVSDAGPPDPASHLRQVFNRMGFNDQVGSSLGWGRNESCDVSSLA